MSNNHTLSLSRRLKSFAHAFRGIGIILASQHNAWLHVVAAVAVVVLGLFFGLTAIEWAVVTLTIAAVFAAEAFNTALEFLSDAVSSEHHPLLGKAKDVAAGAVLLTAIGAAIVGLLVFVPNVLETFGQ